VYKAIPSDEEHGQLVRYEIRAVTSGTKPWASDGAARAGRRKCGERFHDVIEASAKAYVDGSTARRLS